MKLLPCLMAALIAVPAGAEHVATPEAIQARLLSTTEARTRNVDTLVSWASSHGVDARPAVARLSDAELADLAARAEQLRTDPVAGDSPFLIVMAAVGVLLIVLLLIGAAACSDGYC